MKKCVLWVSVIFLALVATALWLSSPTTTRALTVDAGVRPSSAMPALNPDVVDTKVKPSSFPMPPVRSYEDIPEADRKDDELWRKTPEAQAVWNEITAIVTAAKAKGEDATLTTNECAVLIAYMQSPHFFVRWKAVIVAGLGGSEPAKSMLLPHVIVLLSDPVYIVRMFAARILAYIGDKSTIPFLYPLLDDQHPDVASAAMNAIKKLEQRYGVKQER